MKSLQDNLVNIILTSQNITSFSSLLKIKMRNSLYNVTFEARGSILMVPKACYGVSLPYQGAYYLAVNLG